MQATRATGDTATGRGGQDRPRSKVSLMILCSVCDTRGSALPSARPGGKGADPGRARRPQRHEPRHNRRLEAGSARDVRVGTIVALSEALGLEIAAVPAGDRPALESSSRASGSAPAGWTCAGGTRSSRRGSSRRRGRRRPPSSPGLDRSSTAGSARAVQPPLHLALGGRCSRERQSVAQALLGRATGATPSSRTRPGPSPWSRPPVRREDLRRLFARARDLCGETDYVVMGAWPSWATPARCLPDDGVARRGRLTKRDPGRIVRPRLGLGPGSPFEAEFGYYLDPISPGSPPWPRAGRTGSDAHRARSGPRGVVPRADDAAVSKYARMEPGTGVDPPGLRRSAVPGDPGRPFRRDPLPRRPGVRPGAAGAREDRRWLRARKARSRRGAAGRRPPGRRPAPERQKSPPPKE